MSFSTLGVAIILAAGGLFILTHMILEYIVANVIPTKNYKLIRWALDDKLQLQRLAFEGAGVGTWNPGLGAVPTTKRSQTFGMEIGGDKRLPTMTFIDEDEQRDSGAGTLNDTNSIRSRSFSTSKGSGRTWPSTNTQTAESIQLPPIRLFEDDREVWPLVRDMGDNPYSYNAGAAHFDTR